MIIGIIPDEIIVVNSAEGREGGQANQEVNQEVNQESRRIPQMIIENEVQFDYRNENYANEAKINSFTRYWGNYTSKRWQARFIRMLAAAVSAIMINIIIIVIFIALKNSPELNESSTKLARVQELETQEIETQEPPEEPNWMDRNNSTLLQAIILFRYGEISTSRDTYPSDINSGHIWSNGYDDLTMKGMQRMYQLGERIRDHYVFLNNGQYNYSNTLAKSIDVHYCISSTQALLSGLYPANPQNSMFDNFLWRPIPVHTVPKELDEVLDVTDKCQAFQKIKKEKLDEFIISNKLNDVYISKLSNVTGIRINASDHELLRRLFRTLESQKAERLRIHNFNEKRYKKLQSFNTKLLQLLTEDKTNQKYTTGPLLNEIRQHMEDRYHSKSARNIILYGINEEILMNLLGSLDIRNESWNYGSAVVFELHQKDANYPYIKLLKLDETSNYKLRELDLSTKCNQELCYLGDFIHNNEHILAEDLKNACRVIPDNCS